ncbi:hypothetical protein [Paraburkholderia xenovorans]|uniref:hypothetical protein n=1 Tax=Paraburkholderia xenovorans TaxID=36873 RepID=UPI0038B7040E
MHTSKRRQFFERVGRLFGDARNPVLVAQQLDDFLIEDLPREKARLAQHFIRPLVDPTVARTIGLIRRRDAALSSIARDFRLALRRMAPFDPSILHEPA